MADVFISYKREERARVERIASALQELGLSVWFDASLEGGGSFSAQINREVRAAKVVLVCWTQVAAHSEWVIGEADIGRTRGVLAPVFLAASDLPPPFNTIHAYNLMNWNGDQSDSEWLALLDRIGALTGRSGLRHVALAHAAGEPVRAMGPNAAASTNGKLVSDIFRVTENANVDDTGSAKGVAIGRAVRGFVLILLFGPLALAAMRRWWLALASALACWVFSIVVPGTADWTTFFPGWFAGTILSAVLTGLVSAISPNLRNGFARGLGFGRKT